MRALSCSLLLAATVALVGCSTPPTPSPSATGAWPTQRSAAPTLSDEQAHGIAIHALGLVGTPYRYGGNTPDSGFDCSGLIGYVYRNQVGSAPPRTVAQLSSWGQVIDRSERRTGDLVVFGRATGHYLKENIKPGTAHAELPKDSADLALGRLDHFRHANGGSPTAEIRTEMQRTMSTHAAVFRNDELMA